MISVVVRFGCWLDFFCVLIYLVGIAVFAGVGRLLCGLVG